MTATRNARLTTRLSLGAGVIALVPLLALSAAFAVLAQREIRKQLDAALMARARNFAALVQTSTLEPLARDTVLRTWATSDPVLAAGSSEKARAACTQFLAAAAGRMRILAGAELLDVHGTPVCASRHELLAPADPHAGWFRAALDGTVASEGVVPSPRGGDARSLALAIGVVDEKGKPAGVLRAWYEWGPLAQVIESTVTQAHLLDGDANLGVVAGDEALFDTAHDGSTMVPLDHAIGESGNVLYALARSDVAATDPGGTFAYVTTIRRDLAFASLRRLLRMIALLACAGIALSALAAWFLSRRMLRPLVELGRAVRRIEQGDLSQMVETPRDDEIGQLATSFSDMVKKLREVPLSLRQSTEKLTQEVVRLTDTARSQNERVTRQAAALQQAQATTAEIRQTSQLAAERAQAVLVAAERADQVGQAGELAVEQSLGELEAILRHVDSISSTITELGESARRIAGVTDLVKDLADQSNMLALNAAIEAVRSGEHGKAFAVVAREIRALADQSIKATSSVRANLDGIRGTVSKAVTITEQGSQSIAANLTRIRGSGESMRELSSLARENVASVRQIAAAVSQQNAGIDEIVSAVRDVSTSMTDLVQLIDASGDSVRVLVDVSSRIGDVVNQFQI